MGRNHEPTATTESVLGSTAPCQVPKGPLLTPLPSFPGRAMGSVTTPSQQPLRRRQLHNNREHGVVTTITVRNMNAPTRVTTPKAARIAETKIRAGCPPAAASLHDNTQTCSWRILFSCSAPGKGVRFASEHQASLLPPNTADPQENLQPAQPPSREPLNRQRGSRLAK